MKKLAWLAVAATLSAPAMAYEAGDIIIRAGAAAVDPQESSSGDVQAGLDSNTQLGLTGTYMLSENLGVELLAATPFTHKITSSDLGGAEVGEATHLPPTLSLQYYFLGDGAPVQPYVGAGLNYTIFFDEESSLGDGTDLSLDDSLGWAVQAGIDVALDDNWVLNAAVWRIDISTTAEVSTPDGTLKVDVDVDPWVYMIGAGYKF